MKVHTSVLTAVMAARALCSTPAFPQAPVVHQLQPVVVKATPPVVVKKDTTEFTIAAFHARPNADAAALLQKLPGISTAADGTLTAMGQTITSLYVDGKPFFTADLRAALSAIPPELIDKIQILNHRSEKSRLTGVDYGGRNKAINIITRKNTGSGFSGNVRAGAGTGRHYEAAIALSRFRPQQQISLLSQLNNTNKSAFSAAADGASQQGDAGNRQSPVTTSRAAGLHYRNQWSKAIAVSGSYLYNRLQYQPQQQLRTQYYTQTDTLTQSLQQQQERRLHHQHQLQLSLEANIDTANTLLTTLQLETLQQQTFTNQSNHFSRIPGHLLSQGTAASSNHNTVFKSTVDIDYVHRFARKGRNLYISINGLWNSNHNNAMYQSLQNNYPAPDSITPPVAFHQITQRQQRYKGYTLSTAWFEPLHPWHTLELLVQRTREETPKQLLTWQRDAVTHQLVPAAATLNNRFTSIHTGWQTGIRYHFQKNGLRMQLSALLQQAQLTGADHTLNNRIQRRFLHLRPGADVSVPLKGHASLQLHYGNLLMLPGASQLQQVTDYTNPLYIQQGNPWLQPAVNHNLRSTYQYIHPRSQRMLTVQVQAAITRNAISFQTATVTQSGNLPAGLPANTPVGALLTRPVNVNGTYTTSFYGSYSMPLKRPKANITAGSIITQSQAVQLVTDAQGNNAVANYTRTRYVGIQGKFSSNFTQGFDVNIAAASGYTLASWSIHPQKGRYFTQTLQSNISWYSHSGWILTTDFSWYYYGRGNSAPLSIPQLNLQLSRQLFKNKACTVQLFLFDVTGQNKNGGRLLTASYIQDSENNTIGRYGMLSVLYRFVQHDAVKWH